MMNILQVSGILSAGVQPRLNDSTSGALYVYVCACVCALLLVIVIS